MNSLFELVIQQSNCARKETVDIVTSRHGDRKTMQPFGIISGPLTRLVLMN